MKLGISPVEFWKLTFGEFWPLYNAVTKKMVRPMTRNELTKLNQRFLNGEFRRTSR